MRARNDWKVTPGIIELSRPRVHIDGAVCFFDVGSSYPGGAEAAKGGGVHPLKGFVSWVQNAVRQFVWYLLGMLGIWKEGSFSTRGTRVRCHWCTGRPIGRLPGSYAISDKCWTHLSMKHTLKWDTLGHGKNSRLIEVRCAHEGNDVLSLHLLTPISFLLNRKFIYGFHHFFFNIIITFYVALAMFVMRRMWFSLRGILGSVSYTIWRVWRFVPLVVIELFLIPNGAIFVL